MTKTIGLPVAEPIVFKPPKLAAELSMALHMSEVRVSPPEMELARTFPFWRYLRVIEVKVPVAVPSLVLN